MTEDFHVRIAEIKAENPIIAVVQRLGLSGTGKRVWCPACQPAGGRHHKTPDLAIYTRTSSWKCFKCGEGGDCISLVRLARRCGFKEALKFLDGADLWRRTNGGHGLYNSHSHGLQKNLISACAPPFIPKEFGCSSIGFSDPLKCAGKNGLQDLEAFLQACERALPGSLGEKYGAQRGFDQATLQRSRVGFSPPGLWPNAKRDSPNGRLVFPSTDPTGRMVNLYGRSCDFPGMEAPKYLRHDHLPGPKGYFQGRLLQGASLVYVCEGAFDGLALSASGFHPVVAIHGVQSFRFDWFQDVDEVIFAFDDDQAGRIQYQRLAFELILRGHRVGKLSVPNGCKDFAESFLKSGPISI